MFQTALGRLRLVALAEGLSYIILLAIAMPLKYAFGQPGAVKLFGMIHGVLFIILVLALAHAHWVRRWGVRFSLLVFMSSLVPLGAFWMDTKLKAIEGSEAATDGR